MITVYSLLYSYIPNSRDATLQIFFLETYSVSVLPIFVKIVSATRKTFYNYSVYPIFLAIRFSVNLNNFLRNHNKQNYLKCREEFD